MRQNTFIIDGIDYWRTIYPLVEIHGRLQHLQPNEIEACYDWVVTESLRRAMQKKVRNSVNNHYRNDIFMVIFDEVGGEAMRMADMAVYGNSLEFLSDASVKILVTYNSIIIVQSIAG